MKRLFFVFSIITLAFLGCKNKDGFSVSGTIKEKKKEYIRISRLDVDTPVFIDSAKISKKGKFRFRIESEYPDFYQLGYSSSDFITLLAEPGEKIHVTFNNAFLSKDYKVEGSEGTEKLMVLDADLEITKKKLDSLGALYNKASSQPGFDTVGPELEKQFVSVIKEQRNKNIFFIINNITSLASIKALYQKIDNQTYVLNDIKDLQYLKIVNDSLTKYYPDSKHVQALSRDFTNEMNQLYANRLQAMAKNLPEVKLDPELLSIDGKRIALSSLRGKYVLLSFWSVRSQECLSENNQFKDYYKKYRKQGFEIYQINLDADESAWRSTVKFEELPWISVREDDTVELPNARIFNVKSVPANYLFDKEGKIIATNLHGRALQIKLEQLFN
ncbi:MAG TPA: TlpA disulfide reductase family protein [Bacteroidales bacterium]|nr:TlpA disulfide reductase family protein [Bacteroidales bacterium]